MTNKIIWVAKDEPLSLRLTVYGICLLLLLVTLGQVVQWYERPASWGRPIIIVMLLATAYGLFRMKSSARATTVVILWLLVIVLIIGVINPFMASDWMAAGKAPPPVSTLVAIIAPMVAVLLLCLHFLGKYKSRFR